METSCVNGPDLSICIPVYNCAEYLPAALDSILSQADDRTEVIVFDGGSTDQTPQLMQRYLTHPAVRYHRAAQRGGIDADLAACVALASAAYCWLFSGDDVMRPGAVQRARAWMGRNMDVIVCKHTICDIHMRFILDHPVLVPAHTTQRELSDREARLDWFSKAATTEAFFSFISGLVVRKQAWDRGRMPAGFECSCWAHVVRLLLLARDQLRVAYVPEVWLDQRGGNDSFARDGLVNRLRIGIEGYHRIADILYGQASEEAFHIRRVLRNEFTLRVFLITKAMCHAHPGRESESALDGLYARLHSDKSLRSRWLLMVYRMTPACVAWYLHRFIGAGRRLVAGARC